MVKAQRIASTATPNLPKAIIASIHLRQATRFAEVDRRFEYVHFDNVTQPCIASPTPTCLNFVPSTASTPTLSSGISSALSSFLPHRTTPCPSTAKLPAVCHLLPLSVERTLMPSSLSSFDTAGMLPRTCQKLDVPKPHAAYASLSASTRICRFGCLFLEGSGSAASHLSVAS